MLGELGLSCSVQVALGWLAGQEDARVGQKGGCVWVLWPFQQLQEKHDAPSFRQAPRGPCPSLGWF